MRDYLGLGGRSEAADTADTGAGGDLRARALQRRMLQRKARRAEQAADADSAVDQAAHSSGQPLPSGLQAKFQRSLGADLSGVRVHTGGDSARANDAVGARAYTTGNDIHFSSGEYDPSSKSGQQLLAHEVVHTVQQSRGGIQTQHKDEDAEVSEPEDPAEQEADAIAEEMTGDEEMSGDEEASEETGEETAEPEGEESGEESGEKAAKPVTPVENTVALKKHPHKKGHKKGHGKKGHDKKGHDKGAGDAKDKDGPDEKDEKIDELEEKLALQKLKGQAKDMFLIWQKAANANIHKNNENLKTAWTTYLKQTSGNPSISEASLPKESLEAEFAKTFITTKPAEIAGEKVAHLAEKYLAGLAEEGSAMGMGLEGAEVGSVAGPEGAIIGYAVGVMVHTALDIIYDLVTDKEGELKKAVDEAMDAAAAEASNRTGDQILDKSAELDKGETDADADLNTRISVMQGQVGATFDIKEMCLLNARIEAQKDAALNAPVADAEPIANKLLETWVRDHAKTDQKPTDDVSKSQWEAAAEGGMRPSLFVDQCEKMWAANGVPPPGDLRGDYSKLAATLPMGKDMEASQKAIKEHFSEKSLEVADFKVDGIVARRNRHSYCTPILEAGPQGVYVKEWRWEFHYVTAQEELKQLPALRDDQKVSPEPVPDYCEPGTYQSDGPNGRSCEAEQEYDVWAEGKAAPGEEKIEINWGGARANPLELDPAKNEDAEGQRTRMNDPSGE